MNLYFFSFCIFLLLWPTNSRYFCKTSVRSNEKAVNDIKITNKVLYGINSNSSFLYVQDLKNKTESIYTSVGNESLANISYAYSPDGELFLLVGDMNLKVWNRSSNSIIFNIFEKSQIVIVTSPPFQKSIYHFIVNDTIKSLNTGSKELRFLIKNYALTSIKLAEFDHSRNMIIMLAPDSGYIVRSDCMAAYSLNQHNLYQIIISEFLLKTENHTIFLSSFDGKKIHI